MAILVALSFVFLYLALKSAAQARLGSRFDGYFFLMIALAGVCIAAPVRHTLFEHRLARASEALLQRSDIYVDCQSTFDSMFHLGFAGFVYRGSSRINLEVRTCDSLKAYVNDPAAADWAQLMSVHVLTHEAMHVAGEFDERRADCDAFQHNHQTARLLGAPNHVAVEQARRLHAERSTRHPYYSSECRPGGQLDASLPGAVWQS